MARHWLMTGESPKGYRIEPTVWGKPNATREDIQKLKRGRKLGNLRPGSVSHYHAANVTLCDYDAATLPKLEPIYALGRKLGIKPIAIETKRSSSGKGWHVITTWNRDFTPAETVCIQMALGSDMKRETFNLARLLSEDVSTRKDWNFLFSAKCQ